MLMKPTKSSGRKTCKTALNRTQLHLRKERWPRWLNREHDNTRGSLYLLVFVYLLYTFLLTDFPLLSCSKQCCQRWQPHKAQYTIHSCTPGSQVALEFDGGLFLCFFFFCRFQSFETLNRDFLAATYRRKQTKYVDHFIIYLKIVLILISHSKKKIRALIWIKFTIKRTWKCRPQIWRERRSRHAWLWRLTLYLSYQSCFCEVKLRLDWKHTEGEVQLMTWKSVKVVWKEKNSVLGGPWRLPRILGKKRKRKGNNNEFFKSTTLKCNSAEGGKSGGGAPPFKKWWLSKQSSGGGALLELSMALNLWSLIV